MASDPAVTLPEAFAGLRFAVQRLELAEEELRVQNEALVELHTTAQRDQRRYRELFSAAPIPYVVTDSNGVILEANREARRFLGLTQSSSEKRLLVSFVTVP